MSISVQTKIAILSCSVFIFNFFTSVTMANGIANLPNTKACQTYLNYAKSAGATGTYGPLQTLYQRCMKSAPKNVHVKKYKCADGFYLHYFDGIKYCKSAKKLVCPKGYVIRTYKGKKNTLRYCEKKGHRPNRSNWTEDLF